jgi:hypothetical protein
LKSTTNAILVHQIVSGNYKNIKVGAEINISGMNASQLDKLKSSVTAAGFNLVQNSTFSSDYSIQNIQAKDAKKP